MSRFAPSDLVLTFHRMLLGEDPTAPKLSDLIGMWLKETVNDPSVVSFGEASPIYVGGDKDEAVVRMMLNKILVIDVLDTLCLVRLIHPTASGIGIVEADKFVPATDPTLFEKIWAHIAELDKRCTGFSIIDTPRGVAAPNLAPDFRKGYPAFDEIEGV